MAEQGHPLLCPGGGVATPLPLVGRRIVELLVLGRRWREDRGHRQHDGGALVDAAVTHLVEHD